MGLTTSRSKLNYEQFLHAFEEGRKSSYGPRKQDVKIEEQPELTPQEAEHRLRELVGSQVEILERVSSVIWAMSCKNGLCTYVDSKGSDRPAHLGSLIRAHHKNIPI